ncbi:hypothetical protein GCM10022205_16000 [Spinactinospora alkalitolerans]
MPARLGGLGRIRNVCIMCSVLSHGCGLACGTIVRKGDGLAAGTGRRVGRDATRRADASARAWGKEPWNRCGRNRS